MASHGIEVPSLIGEMSCDCRMLDVDEIILGNSQEGHTFDPECS